MTSALGSPMLKHEKIQELSNDCLSYEMLDILHLVDNNRFIKIVKTC